MEAIFHEKQEGSLCAQHCLNALLQGAYFTAVELADIARQLDEKEREQMAEGGTHTEGYQQFLKQPSNNYDDSGFFSVQVIDTALRVWGLELLPYNSQHQLSRQAQEDPTNLKCYICNFGEHWLTVRKLGDQWFNLNSLLTAPELVTDTYLSMFLTQLQRDGYSIFIIVGDLMDCEADQLLRLCPAVQPIKPELISSQQQGAKMETNDNESGVESKELQRVLKESSQAIESDDISLQQALQMSMEGYIEESLGRIDNVYSHSDTDTQTNNSAQNKPCSSQMPTESSESPLPTTSREPDMDEVRKKRLERLQGNDKQQTEDSIDNKTSNSEEEVNGVDEMTEEEMLERAIAMSVSADQT